MFEDFRLKVFITVAKTGSFTKASKHLGISQPAVSQNISALEKETGATLISRNRGEATLTSQGVVFLEYAEKSSTGTRLPPECSESRGGSMPGDP